MAWLFAKTINPPEQDVVRTFSKSNGRTLRPRFFHSTRLHDSRLPLQDIEAAPARPVVDQLEIPSITIDPGGEAPRREPEQNTRPSNSSHEESTDVPNAPRGHMLGWMRQPRKTRRDNGGSWSKMTSGFRTKQAKSQMMKCVISGSILAIILSVYMVLALTTSIGGREFHIFLILLLLMLTIYFCHSFIRLFMIASGRSRARESYQGPVRFGEITEPIPVRFARDDEIAAGETEGNNNNTSLAPPPPAYGLLRGSMRINPDMIYWQRVEDSDTQRRSSGVTLRETRPTTTNRPPSYVSDDGVEYVVDVRPRSIAPPSQVHTSSEQHLVPRAYN